MNKFYISNFITALLALSNAEADSPDRILRQGGRNKLAKLQNMIDTECTDTFTCPVVPPSLDECTFEKPERPSFEGLTQDEIQQLKEDFRAAREERKEQILTCACCGGFTLDEMLPFAQGGGEGEGGSGRPGMFGGGGSRPEGAGRPGMFGGGGSRLEGAGGSGFLGGGGRPGRNGGLRNRQPIGNEVEIEVSVSSADEDEDGNTSGDESTSSFDF